VGRVQASGATHDAVIVVPPAAVLLRAVCTTVSLYLGTEYKRFLMPVY
jgi:hypothetical protein